MTPMVLFGSYAVLVFLAIYMCVYIPNKKKHKKAQEMHASVTPGDVVITIGGIVGRVEKKEENYVTLVIDEENHTTVQVVLYAVTQIKEKKQN